MTLMKVVHHPPLSIEVYCFETKSGGENLATATIDTMLSLSLLYRTVLVYILTADKGIEEDVGKHGYDEPIAGDVADVEGEYVVLDERHDATTYDEHHEDT